MIHIAPWAVAEGLLAGAARVLISEIVRGAGGVLRDKDDSNFFNIAQVDGTSYLANNRSYFNYFLVFSSTISSPSPSLYQSSSQ